MATSERSERLVRWLGGLRFGGSFIMPAWIVAVLGITAASLLFRSQIAATVLPAPHDDGLFLRLANAFGEGDWLGAYDNLTLAKGPAYPLFVAVVGYLHLPLKLAEHAIYLVASAGLSLVVQRLTRNAALGLILYTALALNPVMWGLGLARIIRDGFYVAVTLGVVAISAWLLLVNLPNKAGVRGRGALLALLAGALIAIFVLTREEGVWLGPALGVLVVGSMLRLWASSAGSEADSRQAWRPTLAFVGLRLILVAVGAGAVLGGVTAMNANRYGVPLANDLTDGSFPAAYGALGRIEHDATDRYVPVPASARAEAYRVSPAAAELEPFLDGASGAQWTATSCGGRPDPAKGCTDIRGGWFMWALRQAVDLAGHWSSAPEAQVFLARLAEEINAACDSQKLACGPHRSSVAPPVGLGTLADAAPHALRGLTVMTGADPPARAGVSAGTSLDILRVALKVGPVAPPVASSPPQTQLLGWIAGTAGEPSIVQDQSGGDRGDTQVVSIPAADVDAFFESRGEPNFIGRRFEIITECIDPDCHLLVRGADGEEHRLRTVDLTAGRILETSSLWLYIDAVGPIRSPVEVVLDEAAVTADPGILAAMQWLQGLFGFLLPIAATFGLAGVGLALMLAELRARLAALLILATACAVAVVARLMLIAVIEVTSWPGAMAGSYLAPGSPFLIAFAVIGTYMGVLALSNLVRDRQRQASNAPIDAAAG